MPRIYWPLALLIAFAVTFFGSLALAAISFPAGYDWRYEVMSSLSTPEENPNGYYIAATGMALSGVFVSLLGLCIRNCLHSCVPTRWTDVACGFFVVGGVLLTISALATPGHHEYFGVEKAHAKFAQAATFSFDLGMALTLPAVIGLPSSRSWVRVLAIALILIPVTIYLLCRLLLHSLAAPNSVSPLTHPTLVGNLAFWEWAGSINVLLYILLIIVALRPSPSPSTKPSTRP
jgi:hypothetical protein